MATVEDVAAAIISRVGPVDQMRLNKPLYYAQGWSVMWRHMAYRASGQIGQAQL